MKFADLANEFSQRLSDMSRELSSVEGPLEVGTSLFSRFSAFILVHIQNQQEDVRILQDRLPDMRHRLSLVSSAENECLAANVEENDYTIFTCQDLEFELELVTQSIAKKISFIDNQVSFFYACVVPN